MRYTVKAILANQGTVSLELEAINEEDARQQILTQGGLVLSVQRHWLDWRPKARIRFP